MKISILLFIIFTLTIAMNTQYIKYEEENRIAILTINRPETLNSLNSQILEELENILDSIDINKINALIINGEGKKSFINGIDISEIKKLSKKEGEEFSKKGNNIFRKIETLPIPVIAAINGMALGGGCEIAMSCDIRICSESVIFGLPEVGFGIIPGFGGTQRLSRIVGIGMAKQMIYTGNIINAEEALRIGLVSSIFPLNELLYQAKKLALSIINNSQNNAKNFKEENDEGSNKKGLINENNDFIIFQIQIEYKTNIGEEIYIYGNNTDFGNWEKPQFKMNYYSDYIWKAEYRMPKLCNCIKFKFVCHSNSFDKWEEGDNRLLCPRHLNGLSKTSDGKYILDFVWNHFKINFNIHYNSPNSYTYMQIAGSPKSLSNWQNNGRKPIKMELQNKKQLTAKDGNTITGFWTITVLMKTSDKNNLDFEYRYSLFDEKKGNAIWEREPNRHLHIFLNEEDISNFNQNEISYNTYFLLTNSYLEILDVNFVANLIFDRIGDKNIYMGPYPQSESDFKMLSESGIDCILNVQSDQDLIFRQINYELQLKQAKSVGITIHRYPIIDFNQEDLFKKLKGAGDLLNKLLNEGKKIYVHCTAGMSRSAATVIIYLVLYENYTVEEADNYCKKYRPIICPNYGVINRVASIYKPGSEMSGVSMYNYES